MTCKGDVDTWGAFSCQVTARLLGWCVSPAASFPCCGSSSDTRNSVSLLFYFYTFTLTPVYVSKQHSHTHMYTELEYPCNEPNTDTRMMFTTTQTSCKL